MATYDIDTAHTNLLFSVKHLMVSTVRGTFPDVRGTLELDEDDPTAARGEIRIGAASIDTGFGARDDHLRSADFFDVERHPEIVVRPTAVRHVRGDRYIVTADVTIRDVTVPVDVEAEFLGFHLGVDGARRVGFSGRTRIDRKDWGLDWNMVIETGGFLVGDTISIEIDIAAEEATAPAAADEGLEAAAA